MGRDKAFLQVRGVPLIERVLQVLRGVFRDIFIVTNAPDRYAGLYTTLVIDALDTPGPLTGIYSGLLHSPNEYAFVVACDMPFLNSGLISYLAGLAGGVDIVTPSVSGRPEPLHAVYRRGLLPVIERMVVDNKLKIQDLFTASRVRYVTEAELDRFDPARRSFFNLNTPQEYEEALCAD